MSVIIRLQNLPMSANASNIRRFFGGLAIPEGGVNIVGGNDGDAFIAFATDEDARKAMLLDRQAINGAPVRLFLSSKTEMQTVIDSARNSALFSGIVSTQSSQPAIQKSETMQAMDVIAPTLPSSFSSYRNDVPRDVQPADRQDPFGYKRPLSPPPVNNTGRPQYDVSRPDPFVDDRIQPPLRVSDRPAHQEPIPVDRDYGFERPPVSGYAHYEMSRDRFNVVADYGGSIRDSNGLDAGNRVSPRPYPPYYGDVAYDRRPENQYAQRARDGLRDDPRQNYAEGRYGRLPPEPPMVYDSRSPKPNSERFVPPERSVRDPRDAHPDLTTAAHIPYPPDGRPRPVYPYDREPPFPPRSQVERDFSVRPPWLSEDSAAYGSKRPPQGPAELDDYPPKRRPPVPNSRPPPDKSSPSETEFVVRVTLPIGEVGIKAIFEVLRGVHIVPKWGIRIEEDALQRPTGYLFIMMCARDSFDRALTYDGRIYKSKPVKVIPSNLTEFYKVTDSNFHLKCPPEIAKKLPASDQPVCPPHHADGCLEVADLPPDTTRAEIVRFLGAPGLTASDVTIATFAPADKTATKTPGSVRALVSLPSAKDLEILLSAKARPLRPDGAFPPVRLTPISRVQLEAYSTLTVESKPQQPMKVEPNVSNSSQEPPKTVTKSLTCAYLSGLARPLKDSDVLRLFPSVLIPGDAIHMVGPDNTSAYIDLISENNCRRAVEDITGADSKAKAQHPSICIEAITRSEMEGRRLAKSKDGEAVSQVDQRPSRPIREHDQSRPQWETRPPPRVGRHPSPAPAPFRPRSPPGMGRPKFDEPYYSHPAAFDDIHPGDPFDGPGRRPRPPMDLSHGAMPPPNDYGMPLRPVEALPPPRRPGLDFVTVHVGNLPPSVTVDQLGSIMRDYYFVPGSIRLRRDIQGIPTGEALVDFNSPYDGDRVIRDLNGYRIAGRPLLLEYDRRM